MPAEEQQGVKGLVLGGSSHMLAHRQVGEEAAHLLGSKVGCGAAVHEGRMAPASGADWNSSPTAVEAWLRWATDWFLALSLARKDRGWWVRSRSGHTYGKNRNKSTPTCGSRGVGVAAPAGRPTAAQSQPIPLGEPVASPGLWFTTPTLGRMPRIVVQVAGGGKPKTRENSPLQRQPGGAKMAVMKRTDSSAGAASRWPIIPKWEDRQVCLIPCSAT